MNKPFQADQTINAWRILPRLAWKGIVGNGTVYYPYLGAGIVSVFIYFVFSSILHNDIIAILPKSAYAWIFLAIGRVLLGMILIPFLFYTNSFLIKRRKKEIGLYNLLGLEKKHIGIMMFTESAITYMIAVAAGIVGGTVFSKFLFLLLLRMTGLPVDVKFTFSFLAFGETAVFFLGVYAFCFLSNLIQVGRARPSELLAGGKKGEKEPGFLWLWAFIGFSALGTGYWIAVSSEADSMIFIHFFLAIFLVVAGTYFLFTSGSVAYLKLLKKRKGFYYKPSNFITISGMLYRMKKSAASLVNICIFSTMAMITLICTSSLYLGLGGMMDFNFPFDVDVFWQKIQMGENGEKIKAAELEQKYGVKIDPYLTYEKIALRCGQEGEKLGMAYDTSYIGHPYPGKNYDVNLLLLEDYNKIEDREIKLEDGEVLVFSSGPDYGYDKIIFFGNEFRVKEEPETFMIAPKSVNNKEGELFLIVKEEGVKKMLVKAWAEANGVEDVKGLLEGSHQAVRLDVKGEEEARGRFAEEFGDWCRNSPGCVRFENNLDWRSDWKSMYGGLLFIGILFSIVFIMCLVLIMYYKQIAEGYEDQNAFTIMQKVGMSDGEIKGTIHKQILIVFFVPLIGAVMHTCAGLVMVSKLFAVLRFFDIGLLVGCGAAVMTIFALFYGGSYVVTARTYYRIVSR